MCIIIKIVDITANNLCKVAHFSLLIFLNTIRIDIKSINIQAIFPDIIPSVAPFFMAMIPCANDNNKNRLC